jgi:hypothetical protein
MKKSFKEQLKDIKACSESIEWLQDKSLQEAFATCERADWMLWGYGKLYPNNLKELTLAKAHCANTVRHLMKDERSLKAVDVAISFGEGRATMEELDAAAYAAAASAAYSAAANASAYATYAATYAAAADYAADAAYAAYAANTTRAEALKQMADICRKYLVI